MEKAPTLSAAVLAAAAALLSASPLPAGAQASGTSGAPGAGDRVVVGGLVVDAVSEEPVPGASVHLLSLADTTAVVEPVAADGTGRFRFAPVDSGRYRLRIARIGYRTLTATVRVAPGGDTRLRASLVPDAVDLEPVVVAVSSRRPAFLRAFERRRAQGIGTFLTREAIEEQDPWATSDLFRTVPGVRVVPRGTDGPVLTMRGRCVPQVYIDGIRASQDVSLDHSVRPDAIEAIEVYSSASAPVAYRRNGCGAVLVWTRAPRAPTGEGSFWKRFAVLGGLVLGSLLLSR